VDDIAFDRLTRLFGSAQPRRDAVRAALGYVLAGAAIGRASDALADAGDDELTAEAIAGGRGALGNLGGGSGGKRRARNRKRDKDRGDEKRKRKHDDTCAKAGHLRKDGKPCCKGLYRDSADRCIKLQPAGGSAEVCDPLACPSDPSTKDPGFCCPGEFCSCNNTCCDGPDCWVYSESRLVGERVVHIVREYCTPPAGCVPCPSTGDACCSSCLENGECVPSTQRFGATIRRRPR
jgi:hypothetical protein